MGYGVVNCCHPADYVIHSTCTYVPHSCPNTNMVRPGTMWIMVCPFVQFIPFMELLNWSSWMTWHFTKRKVKSLHNVHNNIQPPTYYMNTEQIRDDFKMSSTNPCPSIEINLFHISNIYNSSLDKGNFEFAEKWLIVDQIYFSDLASKHSLIMPRFIIILPTF